MVAQGHDDCEGDLLERIRALVGPDVIIAAELDPHSHLTAKRVAQANILAAFLEIPHTDFYERGEHLVDLALRALRREIRPVMAAFDCRMINIYLTSREPIRSFVDKINAMQGRDGVLSVSLIHGFMAGDVPEMGTRMLVVTDGDSARRRARGRARHRGVQHAGPDRDAHVSTADGLDRAQALSAGRLGKPVVVADVWDNPGGGVAGDGTLILREVMARRMERVAGFAPLAAAVIYVDAGAPYPSTPVLRTIAA